MSDYFSLLNIALSFGPDLGQLEAAYFREQRQYHPDKFAGKPAAERQTGLQRSVDINKAYQVLKEPLSRAQYLLKLQGVTVGSEKDSIKPSQALLMETLEWREEIEHNSPHLHALETLEKQMMEHRAQSLQVIAREYNNKMWDAMAQETLRLGYIEKALQDIQQRKQRLKQAS